MSEQMALRITGITCAGCEQRAETVLRPLPGVPAATADHQTGRVTVVVTDGRRVDRGQVAARLSAAGFEPVAEGAP